QGLPAGHSGRCRSWRRCRLGCSPGRQAGKVLEGSVVQLACLVSAVSKARLKVGLPLIQALERLGNGGGHAGVSSVRSLFLATLLDLNGAGGSSCRKPHSETVAAVEEDVGRLDT
ncbi:hypothetical protein GGTG_12528, partial [Gaeumannomyces tritici R3-111a-1]